MFTPHSVEDRKGKIYEKASTVYTWAAVTEIHNIHQMNWTGCQWLNYIFLDFVSLGLALHSLYYDKFPSPTVTAQFL